MAGRRRRKNPLLGRIIFASLLVHLIALPILAHFGAFKKLQQQFVVSNVIVVPPPVPAEKKAEAKKSHVEHKQAAAGRKSSTVAARRPRAHQNLNMPKVLAAVGSTPGDTGQPAVEANGNGKLGEVPGAKPSAGPPAEPSSIKETVAPQPQPQPRARPPTAQPQPAAPVKKEPTFTEAESTYAPEPQIPDDLRQEDIQKSLVVEMNVDADGKVTTAKVSQSTGLQELDQAGLDAARTWRFKPATKDGQPVAGIVRLTIDFEVKG